MLGIKKTRADVRRPACPNTVQCLVDALSKPAKRFRISPKGRGAVAVYSNGHTEHSVGKMSELLHVKPGGTLNNHKFLAA
jgi:hypothetical protein